MIAERLSIFYQNARGLRTKSLEFTQNILCNVYDLIVITETWLYDGIRDSEVSDGRYDVFRFDRDLKINTKSTGGGVMIMAKTEFGAQRCVDYCECGLTEILTITLPARSLSSSVDLHVTAVYIPPEPNRISSDIECVLNTLNRNFTSNPQHNYLLIGDFNLPNIHWDDSGPSYQRRGPVEVQNGGIQLISDLGFLGMSQYNTLKNKAGNTLDLSFSNLPLVINRSDFPLVKEDLSHPAFSIDILDISVTPLKESHNPRRNFTKGNYEALNTHFNDIATHIRIDR